MAQVLKEAYILKDVIVYGIKQITVNHYPMSNKSIVKGLMLLLFV